MARISAIRYALIIVLILAIITFLAVRELNHIKVVSLDITSIEDVGVDGFTLKGTLQIYNPSGLEVPVRSVEYQIILKNTGETLATGTIPRFNLAKATTSDARFTSRVAWVPSADLAVSLLKEEQVYITTQVTVSADAGLFGTQSATFHKDTDIKPYVSTMVTKTAQKMLS